MESNKESRHKKYRTVSVYFPKELREQLLFYCRYINIPPSTFCSKLVKRYLEKKNVEQLMHEYAIEQVQLNWKKTNESDT